jgi:hypothetical protein
MDTPLVHPMLRHRNVHAEPIKQGWVMSELSSGPLQRSFQRQRWVVLYVDRLEWSDRTARPFDLIHLSEEVEVEMESAELDTASGCTCLEVRCRDRALVLLGNEQELLAWFSVIRQMVLPRWCRRWPTAEQQRPCSPPVKAARLVRLPRDDVHLEPPEPPAMPEQEQEVEVGDARRVAACRTHAVLHAQDGRA